jgi:perosamine synthetase
MIPSAKPQLDHQESEAVERVLQSGSLSQGAEVASFEREFSHALVSSRHSIAVNSGTSALHLSLLSIGIGPGDEVIVPSFTFAATANAVALTGAVPVFVDIEPNYFTINPEVVEQAITSRTRAVIPVHLYGHPANLDALARVCLKHDLHLVEDAAQAHGAVWNGKPVGTWGTLGCFSFYPTKNMTSGEGGMISTADESLARLLRLLRNQGQERRYENEIVGFNNRMTDIHAAIGRVQLAKLQGFNSRRKEIARRYSTGLSGVVTPQISDKAIHVFHQYTIRVEEKHRDALVEALTHRGVTTGVYYPIPVHELPAFDKEIELPETTKATRECLSLPIFPGLHDDQVDFIIENVNLFFETRA